MTRIQTAVTILAVVVSNVAISTMILRHMQADRAASEAQVERDRMTILQNTIILDQLNRAPVCRPKWDI